MFRSFIYRLATSNEAERVCVVTVDRSQFIYRDKMGGGSSSKKHAAHPAGAEPGEGIGKDATDAPTSPSSDIRKRVVQHPTRDPRASNAFTRKKAVIEYRMAFHRAVCLHLSSFALHHSGARVEVVKEAWKKGLHLGLHHTFKESKEEIMAAYEGGVVKKTAKETYSYAKSVVLVLRRQEQVLSSAIFTVHEATEQEAALLEIVFLATKRAFENQGYASCLFKSIIGISSLLKTSGVVVMANKAAIPWWTSRNASMCRHVVCENAAPDGLNASPKPHPGMIGTVYPGTQPWRYRYKPSQAMHLFFPSPIATIAESDLVNRSKARSRSRGRPAKILKRSATVNGSLQSSRNRPLRRHLQKNQHH